MSVTFGIDVSGSGGFPIPIAVPPEFPEEIVSNFDESLPARITVSDTTKAGEILEFPERIVSGL